MLVFLDLEETLIDEWANMMLMPQRCAAVHKLLKENAGCRVGLMSWAVWHDKDKATFINDLQPLLEEVLDVKFDPELIWSMDDWARELVHAKKRIPRQDLFDCFGKHEVLFMLSRCHPTFKDQSVVLVDDVAEHGLEWRSVTNNCYARMVNVKQLCKES